MARYKLTDEDLFSRYIALFDGLANLVLVLVVPRSIYVPLSYIFSIQAHRKSCLVLDLTYIHIPMLQGTQGRNRHSRRRLIPVWANHFLNALRVNKPHSCQVIAHPHRSRGEQWSQGIRLSGRTYWEACR